MVSEVSLDLFFDYILLFFSEESGEEAEAEDNDYLSVDYWANGVNTDPDLANELQQTIGNILHKCRSTVKMINKSSNLTMYMDQLKENSKIEHGLSLDCKSRWNSTKYMVENILKFKALIGQLHSDKHGLYLTNEGIQKLTSFELSSDEWFMINSINQVLTPFHKATAMMSGQKYPTIGVALFAIRKIKNFLETFDNNSFINAMKDLLLDQMTKYIDNDTEQLDLIVVCTFNFP